MLIIATTNNIAINNHVRTNILDFRGFDPSIISNFESTDLSRDNGSFESTDLSNGSLTLLELLDLSNGSLDFSNGSLDLSNGS